MVPSHEETYWECYCISDEYLQLFGKKIPNMFSVALVWSTLLNVNLIRIVVFDLCHVSVHHSKSSKRKEDKSYTCE